MLASAAVMLAAFSSCEEATEETTIVTYSASGNLSSSTDLGTPEPSIADYTEAIKSVLGGGYATEEMDADVIAACDAVYREHQEAISAGDVVAHGTVEIRKALGSTTSSSESYDYTVIKTYDYNK